MVRHWPGCVAVKPKRAGDASSTRTFLDRMQYAHASVYNWYNSDAGERASRTGNRAARAAPTRHAGHLRSILHAILASILHISGQPRGDILLRMYYESTVMTLRDKTPLAALELKISTVHAAGKRRVRRATARVQGTPSTRQCVGWRLLFDRGHALHIIRQTCHPCRPRPSPCEANRGSSLPQTLRARLRPARHLPRMAARRRMRH